jgi:hypothetical protein
VEKITVEQNKNKGYETIYDEEENLILYSSKKIIQGKLTDRKTWLHGGERQQRTNSIGDGQILSHFLFRSDCPISK